MNDPVVAHFRAVLKGVQSSELERLYRRLPELDGPSRKAISQFAERVVSKMLDPPLESLRVASETGSHHALLESLKRLFRLHEVS